MTNTENKKILIIEDERSLQKAMSDHLIQSGYTVVQALDGEMGIRIAEQEQPAVILLDIVLPHKNGFEVLAELHNKEATRSIPVIVLTNLEGPEEIEKMLSLGATTYLVKANYSLNEIRSKIQGVLRN